ncbi:DEAD/DEAH box helicase [Shewanella sp. 202IG2-18]|uniref:DEAD/DEAH box helicase n=1 Tax=Parashewanella hymeniacidonis TaxID=2807618 RepID=UPI001961854B|nr:DEAD/DEAH box helicase [Parashewanella hymeniacidonis]MBM7074645.1 DEAD/DEAH box helicase [Parashewanella hymeniacidonis]
MSFKNLGLSDPILSTVSKKGYEKPSPIQEQAIPAVLAGKDVLAAAQTGTGKTAGFTLPLLDRLDNGNRVQPNQVRALVLTPTRELAAQVHESVEAYGRNLRLRSTVVFGGVKINPQMMKLRRGVDILVATPGRLLDLYHQKALNFKQLEVLVLDEADRMLDMGFIHDIRRILALLPKQRQNLMFSATFSDDIRALAKTIVHNPVEISVTPPNSTVKRIEQWLHVVDKSRKMRIIIKLIKQHNWQQVLIFSRTKHGANRITRNLIESGIKAAAIHGNKSQGARTKALSEFKSGQVKVLVATDIAARGLDIDQLPQVVNFDLPTVAEDYVHRIGRTGRAGAIGCAVSLVSSEEAKQLKDIENLIQELIPRKVIEGYEATHNVPETNLVKPKPKKPKKPKANKVSSEPQKSQAQNGDKSQKQKSNRKPNQSKRNSSQNNNNRKNSAPKKRVRD